MTLVEKQKINGLLNVENKDWKSELGFVNALAEWSTEEDSKNPN